MEQCVLLSRRRLRVLHRSVTYAVALLDDRDSLIEDLQGEDGGPSVMPLFSWKTAAWCIRDGEGSPSRGPGNVQQRRHIAIAGTHFRSFPFMISFV